MTDSPNIALVQAMYASSRSRDYVTFRDLCAPDLVWRQNPGFPGGGVHEGADAVIAGVYGAFAQRWASFRFEAQTFRNTGDAVLVTGAYHGTALQTGKTVTADACHVIEIAEGKISRFQQYADTKLLWDALT